MKITFYELWKDIKDFEGLYQISNLGNIKSLPKKHNLKNGHSYIQKEQILKPFNNKGYLQIALVKNGKHYKRQVHNLVATAFIENPNNYIEINHKDENKLNNCVDNLEWCSHIYNSNYGNRNKKISKALEKKINQYDLDGNFIKTWNSQLEIQKELKIPQASISAVVRGIYKQTHGYRWELAKHVDYFNLIYLIKNYNPSVELLTKMKLYNLALCPKSFRNKRTFEERFMGLSKDYLPFIQEYNLDIDELITLSFIKEKNINFLKRCKGMGQDNLEQLQEKVNIKILLNKTNFSSENYYEYRDYLDLVKKLKLNMKDKTILYPKNIKKAHDKALKEYTEKKDILLNNSIIKKYKSLKCNIFEDKKYIIFPAENMDALIDESSQQNNCVRTYADRIASGKCDIYFMRLVSDQNKSLVTIEVKNKKVVQKRTKHNGNTTLEQDKFITKWERKILNKESMCNDRNRL